MQLLVQVTTASLGSMVERERDRDRERDRRDDVEDRLRRLEDDLNKEKNFRNELKEDVASVAKLGVFTARGLQESQGRYKVCCFLTGEFKKTCYGAGSIYDSLHGKGRVDRLTPCSTRSTAVRIASRSPTTSSRSPRASWRLGLTEGDSLSPCSSSGSCLS